MACDPEAVATSSVWMSRCRAARFCRTGSRLSINATMVPFRSPSVVASFRRDVSNWESSTLRESTAADRSARPDTSVRTWVPSPDVTLVTSARKSLKALASECCRRLTDMSLSWVISTGVVVRSIGMTEPFFNC